MKNLTIEDVDNFKRDGFLVKEKFFDKDEISEIRNWVYEYAIKKSSDWKKGQEMGYYETSLINGERILTRLENFIDYHKKFHDLVTSEEILDSVEKLLGERAVFFKDKINFKNPGGAGFQTSSGCNFTMG